MKGPWPPKTAEHKAAISRATKGNPKLLARPKRGWTPEQRAAHSQISRNSKTADVRARTSASWKRHIEKCGGICGSSACTPRWRNTSLETKLEHLLADFPDMKREVQFGPYRVDAYLPEHHLAFEADGYWHQFQRDRDQARDEYLASVHELPVVRLTTSDLQPIMI